MIIDLYKKIFRSLVKYIDKCFETKKENRNLNSNVFLIALYNFINHIAMF